MVPKTKESKLFWGERRDFGWVVWKVSKKEVHFWFWDGLSMVFYGTFLENLCFFFFFDVKAKPV